MNIYDRAHQLAGALRESEEYREYARLRDIVYQDETNKSLLDEYKRLQFRLQARVTAGQGMDASDEGFQRMQSILQVLQFNPDCSAYIMAEFRFQKLLADIYKILADVAGVDLDLLTQN